MQEKIQNFINFSYRDDFKSMETLLKQEPLLFFYNHDIIKEDRYLLPYLGLHIFSHYRLKPASKKQIAITSLINDNIEFLINNDLYNIDAYIDDKLIQGNVLLYNFAKLVMVFNDIFENPIENDLLIKLLEIGDPNTIVSYENKEEVLLFSLIYHSSLDFKYIKPFFNQYLDVNLLERKDTSLLTFDPAKERYLTLAGVLIENMQYREKELSSVLELLLFLFKEKTRLNNPYSNIEDNNIYKLFKFSRGVEGNNSDNAKILEFLIKNMEKHYGRSLWKSITPDNIKTLSTLNPDFYLKWFSFSR